MKIIKKLFSIGLISLICLILIELSMIILEPYIYTGMYQYDPDMGFKVRPYYDGTNRFGFNAKDFPLERQPNTFRIIIIGDSFNWSGGKDWNYTVLLDKKLQQYYGDNRIEVINVGYPGTHTGEQLVMLKKLAIKYNPDLVFLGFFAGNDFYDADPYRKRIIINDLSIDIEPRHELKILNYPIVPVSRLILFFQQKFRIYQELIKASHGSGKKGTWTEETFFNGEMKHLRFCNLRLQEEGMFKGNKDYIFRSIDEMDFILKARNIKFIVGIYPAEFQVNEEILNQIFTKYHLNSQEYDVEFMQKILKRYLDKKGIYYVDLLNKFKTVGRQVTLYKFRDTHWNEAGNKLAADIIFPELLKYINIPN
jgi:hypothetical protein